MRFGLREIAFMVLLMIIPLGAWWFVFRPQNARNNEMRRQIETRQAKLRQLNKTVGTIGDLEKQIASLAEAVSYFKSKLPDEKEMDKILQEIWMLAESNNLHAKSIRTRTRKGNKSDFLPEDSEQAEQPIVIKLEGDFLGFYGFLLALENQPRIMRIRTMDLKTPERCAAGRISAEFEMSIFFEQNHKEQPWPLKASM